MSKPDDYVWVARWGRLMGSYDPYIKGQQKKAAEDNAPLTATFENDQDAGVWNTIEDITNENTLLRLAQMNSTDKEAVRILTEQIASLHKEGAGD